MANRTVTRTHIGSIRNQRQVCDDLDSLGFAASKLWNVARWTVERVWSETGHIPGHAELSSYLKSHERYADLNAQSSQRVIQELAEAFKSWYGHRQNGNQNANPPAYRKHDDQHPRSTVTFKEDGFKHDPESGRVRLSKGRNFKAGWSDFILCEYAVDPAVTIENVQQVRAVYDRGEGRLHFICRHEIDPDPPGEGVAGIDLGISNVAAVSFGGEGVLYPGGALKEDEYWFQKERAKCENASSTEADRFDRKRTERRSHFLHTLSKDVVTGCVERGVGTIVVGDISGIRDDEETGAARNWGDRGNLGLHGWAFDRFTSMLEYKAEEQGIDVERVDESGTSKTCSVCGSEDRSQRVERGLYVCESCGTVANADIIGAENIRVKVLPSLAPDGGDRDNGWMAQPAVRLFARSEGRFAPREQVTDCKP